jgi:hypothetical protein
MQLEDIRIDDRAFYLQSKILVPLHKVKGKPQKAYCFGGAAVGLSCLHAYGILSADLTSDNICAKEMPTAVTLAKPEEWGAKAGTEVHHHVRD